MDPSLDCGGCDRATWRMIYQRTNRASGSKFQPIGQACTKCGGVVCDPLQD